MQKELPGLKAESPTGCLSGTLGWGGAPQVLGELGRTLDELRGLAISGVRLVHCH